LGAAKPEDPKAGAVALELEPNVGVPNGAAGFEGVWLKADEPNAGLAEAVVEPNAGFPNAEAPLVAAGVPQGDGLCPMPCCDPNTVLGCAGEAAAGCCWGVEEPCDTTLEEATARPGYTVPC